MSLQSIQLSYKDRLADLGKAGLHALYPNDFPFYFLALELVDSKGNTVDYLAWPILPEEIRESHMEITTIRKTIGGVNVLKNGTFTPRQIFIRGTFGRNFKLLLGRGVEFAGFGLSINNGKFKLNAPNLLQDNTAQFSSFAKTGYGCIKIIESMKEKSKKLDSYQKPFSLYLYNPILGNNYQVEFSTGNSFNHFQNERQNNQIPGYQIQLTAIAPLDSVFSRLTNIQSVLKNLTLGGLQKTANKVAGSIRGIKGIGL